MSSYRNRNQSRRDYVPKWKQEEEAKKAEEKAVAKSLENTEDNFPSLGGKMVAPKTMWAGGPAKFKDLASEWRQKEEMEKVTGDQAVKQDTVLYPDMVLPTFNNVHRYTDEEEKEDEEEEEEKPAEKKFEQSEDEKKEDDQLDIGHTEEDDGWVTVQHKKPRKDKTAKKSEEIQARTEEDFETSSQGSDTVWNANLPMGPGKKNNYS